MNRPASATVEKAGAAFYLGLTLLSWASSFVAMRLAVRSFEPGSLVLLRCLLSAVLVTLCVLPGTGARGFFRLGSRDLGLLLAMALTGALAYNLFLAQGQQTLTTFAASLLINTVPIWTALFALLLFREHLSPMAWFGVALGFGGAMLVGWRGGGLGLSPAGAPTNWAAAMAVLLAALCQGFYFVLLRQVVGRVGPGRTTAWTFWIAALAAFPFLPSLLRDLATGDSAATLAIVYLSVIPGGLGVWSWSRAARRLPAARQAVFLYLVPPLTALMGWGFLGEVPSGSTVLGGLVTLLGAAIVTFSPRPRAGRPAELLVRVARWPFWRDPAAGKRTVPDPTVRASPRAGRLG